MTRWLDVRDVVLLCGVLLLAGGCGWIYAPLGAIVPGAIFVWMALAPGHRKSRGDS